MRDLAALALDCYGVGAGDRVRVWRHDELGCCIDSGFDAEIVRVQLNVDSAD